MEKFNQFKKELKKINTKKMLKEYKDFYKLGENQKAYTLYFHDLILCGYEPRDQIFNLIKEYKYEIRHHGTVDGAMSKSKELNCKILLIIDFE